MGMHLEMIRKATVLLFLHYQVELIGVYKVEVGKTGEKQLADALSI